MLTQKHRRSCMYSSRSSEPDEICKFLCITSLYTYLTPSSSQWSRPRWRAWLASPLHRSKIIPHKSVIHQLSCSGARLWVTSQALPQEIFPFLRKTLWDFRCIIRVCSLKHSCYLKDRVGEDRLSVIHYGYLLNTPAK